MKVLTLTSMIFLLWGFIAGVMGMNFQVALFEQPAIFYVIVTAMALIGPITFFVAKSRRVDLTAPPSSDERVETLAAQRPGGEPNARPALTRRGPDARVRRRRSALLHRRSPTPAVRPPGETECDAAAA